MFGFVKKFISDKKKQKPKWQEIKGDSFEKNIEKSVQQVKGEAVKIVSDVISIKGFLGDIKNMDEKELSAQKKKDEQESKAEAEKIRSQLKGRNVSDEMQQFSQKQQQEEEREKQMAEQRRQQLERDRLERQSMQPMEGGGKKKPGKAEARAAGGQRSRKAKVTSEPSQEQLTQTGEFTQKME